MMPYSYDRYVGIFYKHNKIDMITHNMAFGDPVCGTGGSKLETCR